VQRIGIGGLNIAIREGHMEIAQLMRDKGGIDDEE